MAVSDNILGCLMGGMVGDAAGAPLEFCKRIEDTYVDLAMELRGGGPLGMGPGQVTDDSELMLALLTALVYDEYTDAGADAEEPEKAVDEKESKIPFPKHRVARRYIEWYKSDPFDIGTTCARAFEFASDGKSMTRNAQKYNTLSESNGALMRCAPIACWGVCRGLSFQNIAQAAREDALLSHPNRACQDASALLCCVLARVFSVTANSETLKGSTTSLARHALEEIQSFMEQHRNSPVSQWIREAREIRVEKKEGVGHDDDGGRLSEISQYYERCKINVGHAKHAIVFMICVLNSFAKDPGYCFERAIREVIRAGGDSDTNACICGYVAGAITGASGIPHAMRSRLFAFDCSSVRESMFENEEEKQTRTHAAVPFYSGHRRPAVYRTANLMPLFSLLTSTKPAYSSYSCLSAAISKSISIK